MTDPSQAPARGFQLPRYVWIIAILFLLYAFSMIDRQILAILSSPVKQSLGLNDFELSLLLGPAFAVSYILFGPLFGVLTDRWSGPKTICIGLLIWMLGTAACGFAGSFVMLAAFRMLVGAGEAALSPAAYAIIANSVPKHRLGISIAVYSWGSMLGTSLSLIIGGFALGAFSERPPIGIPGLSALEPWQLVFLLVALPGIVLCPLSLLLPSSRRAAPARQIQEANDTGVLTLRAFVSSRRVVLTSLFLVYGLTALITYTTIRWTPQFLERAYGLSSREIGARFGLLALSAPILGSLFVGLAVDRWFKAGRSDAHTFLYLIALLACGPFMLLTFTTDHLPLFWIGLASIMALTSAAIPAGSAALQILTPAHLRGQISGAFVSFINIMGAMIGPVLAGFLVNFVFKDEAKLGLALSAIIGVSVVLIVPLLFLASRAIRRI